jgi:hypothetical protein
LRINGRMDRIDRVAGGRVIIDYKSGEAGARETGAASGRPNPRCRCTRSHREDLAGLVYASLKPGDVRLKGLARRRMCSAQH